MDPQFFTLLRGFFALVSPEIMIFPENMAPSRLNDFFVTDILLNPHFQRYPPCNQYQQKFWKWVIQNLEDMTSQFSEEEDYEIHARIYDHYIGLMSHSVQDNSPPSPSYITYFWHPYGLASQQHNTIDFQHYSTATLMESRTTIENGSTGFRTWLASLVLAQYLISNPNLIISQNVLELGSGIGFLGIVVGTLQQQRRTPDGPSSSLWLTDISDRVLDRCRQNLKLECNVTSSHPSINFLKLDWFSSVNVESPDYQSLLSLIHEKVKPDIIIGADISFDPTLVPCLVETINLCLRECAKYALIASTVRNESTFSYFLMRLHESSLHVEEVALTSIWPFHPNPESPGVEGVKVFRISRFDATF